MALWTCGCGKEYEPTEATVKFMEKIRSGEVVCCYIPPMCPECQAGLDIRDQYEMVEMFWSWDERIPFQQWQRMTSNKRLLVCEKTMPVEMMNPPEPSYSPQTAYKEWIRGR